MNSRPRLALLLLLAALLFVLAISRGAHDQLHVMLPWPRHCDGVEPVWLDELISEARNLGYPGFQLSFSNVSGVRTHCAAGWAKWLPWPERLRTDHVMRYASLSKIFTSVVATRLSARNELDLNAGVVDKLALDLPLADTRLARVSVADLLRHTAGFDRALTPDPMMHSSPWCPADMAKLADVRLDHPPGEVFAYSNLGYCILGEIISRQSGAPLSDVFHRQLFEPYGVQMVALSRGERLLGEPDAWFDDAAGDSLSGLLSLDYGSMQATGAWAGNAANFLKVLQQVSGPSAGLLSARQQRQLLEVAHACDVANWRTCHGNGFYHYRAQGGASMYWRDGSLPGATSFAAVLDDGRALVFLAHGRHFNWKPDNDRLGIFFYRHFAN